MPVSCRSESCLAQLPAEPDPPPGTVHWLRRYFTVNLAKMSSTFIQCFSSGWELTPRHTEGVAAADGGGRGPPKPVINYYLIGGGGSAHQMRRALCLLPAHLLVFPALSKILQVWPWVPRTDFGMDGMLLFKVTQNSEV